MFPNFDCDNTDYSPTGGAATRTRIRSATWTAAHPGGGRTGQHFAPCILSDPPEFGGGRAPQVFRSVDGSEP